MSEQPCAGPCNRAYREAWDAYRQALADYDPLDSEQSRPDPPSLQPWLGEPLWCRECAARVSLRLAQLDSLAAMLAMTADGHRTADAGERVSRSDSPGSPSPVADDLDELSSMLAAWEQAYRDLKGWPAAPPRGDLATTDTERIAWLSRHLRGILACPDIAADFGNEILQWHRRMAGKAKAGVRTLQKPLRCPSCQFLTLTWTEGDKDVRCQNPACYRILSLTEYENETERLAAEHSAA